MNTGMLGDVQVPAAEGATQGTGEPTPVESAQGAGVAEPTPPPPPPPPGVEAPGVEATAAAPAAVSDVPAQPSADSVSRAHVADMAAVVEVAAEPAPSAVQARRERLQAVRAEIKAIGDHEAALKRVRVERQQVLDQQRAAQESFAQQLGAIEHRRNLALKEAQTKLQKVQALQREEVAIEKALGTGH